MSYTLEESIDGVHPSAPVQYLPTHTFADLKIHPNLSDNPETPLSNRLTTARPLPFKGHRPFQRHPFLLLSPQSRAHPFRCPSSHEKRTFLRDKRDPRSYGARRIGDRQADSYFILGDEE